jgi:hypothetical protein
MENVVKSLISIDENASKRLEQAKKDNEQRIVDAKKIAVRKYNELIARADIRIQKVDKFYEDLKAEELTKQNDKLVADLKIMDDILKGKKIEIIDSMYGAIVN